MTNIDSKTTEHDNELQVVTPQDLSDLMNSLQRVFRIGMYYPAGHTVADQAAASFLHSLTKVAGKNATFLHFAVSETTLSLQGIELNQSLHSVKIFHDLLHSLSIATLDIHRDITADELRLFITKMLSFRARLQSSRDFQEIKITGMPQTVKIHQLQFLASPSATDEEGSGDASQPTIDYLLSSLVQHGLKAEQLSICRQLLESIPDTLGKRQISESDLPSVTWGDVEKLLFGVAEFIQSSDKDPEMNLPENHYNIDALIAILKSLEETTDGDRSREAVNLLIKLTRGSLPQSKDGEQKRSKRLRSRDRPGISLGKLNKALLLIKKSSLPAHLFANDRSEELSILMLMLGEGPRLQVMMRIQETLRDCLTAPLEPREWQIVTRGMRQLVKILDSERLHGVFFMILEILRRSRHTTPLIFLKDVCQGLTRTEFTACWPFLVNEILIEGPQKEPELFLELSTLAGCLPEQYMRNNLNCIKGLDALSENRVAASIFSPPPSGLHPFFALLLDSQKTTYITKRLVLGLRQQSFGWLDKAVAPLLDSTLPSDRQFIIDLLQQDNAAHPSQGLKKKGMDIIIERLPAISLEQRKEGWVPDTVRALSRVRLRAARNVLNDIVKSRQYLIIPEWPGPARKAAREVLRNY